MQCKAFATYSIQIMKNENLKQILEAQIKDPKKTTAGTAIVAGFLFVMFACGILGSVFLIMEPIIGQLFTLAIILLLALIMLVLFIMGIFGTYNVYDQDNKRYRKLLKNSDLFEDWEQGHVLIYQHEMQDTYIYKTANYLCVIEDLIQGPFCIPFSKLAKIEIVVRDTYKGPILSPKYSYISNGLEFGCSFTERGEQPLTFLMTINKEDFPKMYEQPVYKCLVYLHTLTVKPEYIFEHLRDKEKTATELVAKLRQQT